MNVGVLFNFFFVIFIKFIISNFFIKFLFNVFFFILIAYFNEFLMMSFFFNWFNFLLKVECKVKMVLKFFGFLNFLRWSFFEMLMFFKLNIFLVCKKM